MVEQEHPIGCGTRSTLFNPTSHSTESGEQVFEHPVVGRMRLGYESMPLTGTGGQRLVVYLAAPGTPDHDAIVLLDMVATTNSAEQSSPRG